MYGAAEMFLSPEVAIVQHATGVMQVSWDYFENGITFFTNLVYTAIRFSVGSGEVAPFVVRYVQCVNMLVAIMSTFRSCTE